MMANGHVLVLLAIGLTNVWCLRTIFLTSDKFGEVRRSLVSSDIEPVGLKLSVIWGIEHTYDIHYCIVVCNCLLIPHRVGFRRIPVLVLQVGLWWHRSQNFGLFPGIWSNLQVLSLAQTSKILSFKHRHHYHISELLHTCIPRHLETSKHYIPLSYKSVSQKKYTYPICSFHSGLESASQMLSLQHSEKTSFSMVKRCLWDFGSHLEQRWREVKC